MYYQDSEKSKESLLNEQTMLKNKLETLRQEKAKENRTYNQPNYQDNYYNMKSNNKKVMLEAIPKMILITLVSTFALTILGSIFITNLLPLIISSAAIGTLVAVPISLTQAARKMINYDRQNSPRQEYHDNSNYMAITTEINNTLQRLREIDGELRRRNESKDQVYSAPVYNQGLQVYPSQAYYGQGTRLYGQPQHYNQPQMVVINGEKRHR